VSSSIFVGGLELGEVLGERLEIALSVFPHFPNLGQMWKSKDEKSVLHPHSFGAIRWTLRGKKIKIQVL